MSSVGDDNKLIVWRTHDWQIEEEVRLAAFGAMVASGTFKLPLTLCHQISEPLEGASKSVFRRMDWSPDGATVCTTNAYKVPCHVHRVADCLRALPERGKSLAWRVVCVCCTCRIHGMWLLL